MLPVEVHNAVADAMEVGAVVDWIDPAVAFMERVACPFGCKLIGIALENEKAPAHYEKLLKRGGVDVKGIELFEGSNVGDFVYAGYACITVAKKHLKKASAILKKAGASFVYR